MDYKDTLNYLYNSVPMFQQVGSKAYKEGLENTIAFDEYLGHPHREFRSIHVAGTNGKGSCSHTLAAILQSAGYRVGLYTSPHLIDFRERIRVNGEPVSESYVVRFVEEHRPFFEPLSPSFFELTTAMAFRYFADEKIDIAIIEVGMGGRLDCTNIIRPELCIITNISLDHTQFLGDTLEKIAAEKAGIIKEGVPVVIGATTEETRPVFLRKAEEASAPIEFVEDEQKIKKTTLKSTILLDQVIAEEEKAISECTRLIEKVKEVLDKESIRQAQQQAALCQQILKQHERYYNAIGWVYEADEYPNLESELGGFYQPENAEIILHALSQLKTLNYRFEEKDVRYGFAHVCELTGLMGRWQKVNESPLMICDTGHNVAGISSVISLFSLLQYKKLHIVIGMVNDKDICGILELLPKEATYYFTKASVKRALPEKELRNLARNYGLRGNCYPSVAAAVKAAKNKSLPQDFIFVGGSSFIVADLLASRNTLNLH